MEVLLLELVQFRCCANDGVFGVRNFALKFGNWSLFCAHFGKFSWCFFLVFYSWSIYWSEWRFNWNKSERDRRIYQRELFFNWNFLFMGSIYWISVTIKMECNLMWQLNWCVRKKKLLIGEFTFAVVWFVE